MPTLLVLGASSDIAKATALEFAQHNWNILLAGRNMEPLSMIAQDISIRAKVKAIPLPFDALKCAEHQIFWDALPEKPDVILCSVGMLGDQQEARHNINLAEKILSTNFTALVPILSIAADFFERQGRGTIIGISSVAGDRGRASNYVYGSAKAGLSTFLAGLRHRLSQKGVEVMVVKPGFVKTSMTEGMALPPFLTANPEEVGRVIWEGFRKHKDEIYIKRIWYFIMLIIRHIPNIIFKHTSL